MSLEKCNNGLFVVFASVAGRYAVTSVEKERKGNWGGVSWREA